MGMKQETTSQNYAGAQTPYGQQALEAMQAALREAQGLQNPSLQITGQDRAMVGQAQEASGQMARMQMDQNMEQILRQLEDTAIGRGIQGSSLEAVNNALVGQDFQRQLAMLAMQQQGQGAQQLMNLPFQRAQAENQANLNRFQMLTGAAAPMMNYDMGMRQMTGSTVSTQSGGLGPQLLEMGMRGGAAYLTGGISEVVNAAGQSNPFGGTQSSYFNQLNPQQQAWSEGARASGEPWRPR